MDTIKCTVVGQQESQRKQKTFFLFVSWLFHKTDRLYWAQRTSSNQTYKRLSLCSEILKYIIVFSTQKYDEFSNNWVLFPLIPSLPLSSATSLHNSSRIYMTWVWHMLSYTRQSLNWSLLDSFLLTRRCWGLCASKEAGCCFDDRCPCGWRG